MEFMKKLGRGLSSSVLKFSLFTLAIVSAAVMVYGSPAQIKETLKDNGVYDNLLNNVLEASQQEAPDQQEGSTIPLNQPEIKAAINKSVSPQFLQSNIEQIIDGSYKWLNSETPNPVFRVDLTPVKQDITNAIADYSVKRAQTLPVCNIFQLRELLAQGNNIDPFSATCIPPGLSMDTIRQEVIRQTNSNEDFLGNPVVTADTLPRDERGRTVFDKLDQAPRLFRIIKTAPYILGGLALVSAAVLIFLYDERRRALRTISITFIGTAAFLFISTWVLSYLFAQMNKPGGVLGKTGGNQAEQTIVTVIRSLNNAINQRVLIFCVAYLAIGLGLLLALKLTRPKSEGIVATGEPEPAVTEKTTETPSATNEEVAKDTELK